MDVCLPMLCDELGIKLTKQVRIPSSLDIINFDALLMNIFLIKRFSPWPPITPKL